VVDWKRRKNTQTPRFCARLAIDHPVLRTPLLSRRGIFSPCVFCSFSQVFKKLTLVSPRGERARWRGRLKAWCSPQHSPKTNLFGPSIAKGTARRGDFAASKKIEQSRRRRPGQPGVEESRSQAHRRRHGDAHVDPGPRIAERRSTARPFLGQHVLFKKPPMQRLKNALLWRNNLTLWLASRSW